MMTKVTAWVMKFRRPEWLKHPRENLSRGAAAERVDQHPARKGHDLLDFY
jgi:hypothetical protein